jgi:hypothetical protein
MMTREREREEENKRDEGEKMTSLQSTGARTNLEDSKVSSNFHPSRNVHVFRG